MGGTTCGGWVHAEGTAPGARADGPRGAGGVPKRLGERVEEIQRLYPLAQVQVWAQDEHRVGLKPILRRVWSPKRVRPTAAVRPRYEWLWVYGFVHPETGRTEWLLMPYVDKQSYGAGPQRRIVLVVDQAGWHTARQLQIPEGLHLEFLPAYCPELQPAERLWPLCDEGLANKLFRTIADLEEAVADRLVRIKDDAVRRLTSYYWWPRTTSNPIAFSRS